MSSQTGIEVAAYTVPDVQHYRDVSCKYDRVVALGVSAGGARMELMNAD